MIEKNMRKKKSGASPTNKGRLENECGPQYRYDKYTPLVMTHCCGRHQELRWLKTYC